MITLHYHTLDKYPPELRKEIETCAYALLTACFIYRQPCVFLALYCIRIMLFGLGNGNAGFAHMGSRLAGGANRLQMFLDGSSDAQKALASEILNAMLNQESLNAFELAFLSAMVKLVHLDTREEMQTRSDILEFLSQWTYDIYYRGLQRPWYKELCQTKYLELFDSTCASESQALYASSLPERMIKLAVYLAHNVSFFTPDDFVAYLVIIRASRVEDRGFTLREALQLYNKFAFVAGAEEPVQREINPMLLQFVPFQVCHRDMTPEENELNEYYLANVTNLDLDTKIPAKDMIAIITYSLYQLAHRFDDDWGKTIYHPMNMVREMTIPAPVTRFVWFDFSNSALSLTLDVFGRSESIRITYPDNCGFGKDNEEYCWELVLQAAGAFLEAMGVDPSLLMLSAPESVTAEQIKDLAIATSMLPPMKAVNMSNAAKVCARTDAALLFCLDRIPDAERVAVIYEDVSETELVQFHMVRNQESGLIYRIDREKADCIKRGIEDGESYNRSAIEEFCADFYTQFPDGHIIRIKVSGNGKFPRSTIDSSKISEEYPGVFFRGSHLYQFFVEAEFSPFRFHNCIGPAKTT